jgi:L-amino acid N-acyltransferase YncA
MIVRDIKKEDVTCAIDIWNEVVEEGVVFPQMECLDEITGWQFFESQTKTRVIEEDGNVVALYILHPNNVGRCGHICNASYAVSSKQRGKHIGEVLVMDCLSQAKQCGFKILQFNAVVANNTRALSLYKKLGFIQLGKIPHGFLMKDGSYQDIIPHYIEL